MTGLGMSSLYSPIEYTVDRGLDTTCLLAFKMSTSIPFSLPGLCMNILTGDRNSKLARFGLFDDDDDLEEEEE